MRLYVAFILCMVTESLETEPKLTLVLTATLEDATIARLPLLLSSLYKYSDKSTVDSLVFIVPDEQKVGSHLSHQTFLQPEPNPNPRIGGSISQSFRAPRF